MDSDSAPRRSASTLLSAIEALNPLRFAERELQEAQAELAEAKLEMARAVNRILADADVLVRGSASPDLGVSLMETCAFNDLVGQRIDKVSAVMAELDARLSHLATSSGVGLRHEAATDKDRRRQDLILHGPAMSGAGVTQAEIDSLFD